MDLLFNIPELANFDLLINFLQNYSVFKFLDLSPKQKI